MSIKTVKFPFTSSNGIEAYYSLELQGHLTRDEFDKRIRELNETSNKSRLNRFVTFLPLYIILVSIAIVLPLVFTRQFSNVSNNFNFEDFKKDTRASFTTWAWTIMGIFIGFILALILTSCLNHRSRINQFRAHTKKLNELNVIDNPKGINWKIDTDTGYINVPRSTYNSYRNSRELYNQKYLVIEVGPSSSFMNNQITVAVSHTPTTEMDDSSPPAYHE